MNYIVRVVHDIRYGHCRCMYANHNDSFIRPHKRKSAINHFRLRELSMIQIWKNVDGPFSQLLSHPTFTCVDGEGTSSTFVGLAYLKDPLSALLHATAFYGYVI
jgi:hypothetical protein